MTRPGDGGTTRAAWALLVAALLACGQDDEPGNSATEVGEQCVESDLVAQCPPGANPVLGASAQSTCAAAASGGDVVDSTGAVTGRCLGSGSCLVVCRFASPCACGVDAVTRDGVFCTDCSAAAVCGDGKCTGGESPTSCAQDCGAVCSSGEERCEGRDRAVCDAQGRWETVPCAAGTSCRLEGAAARCENDDIVVGDGGMVTNDGGVVSGRIEFGDGVYPTEGTGVVASTGDGRDLVALNDQREANGEFGEPSFWTSAFTLTAHRSWYVPFVRYRLADDASYVTTYGSNAGRRSDYTNGPPPASVAADLTYAGGMVPAFVGAGVFSGDGGTLILPTGMACSATWMGSSAGPCASADPTSVIAYSVADGSVTSLAMGGGFAHPPSRQPFAVSHDGRWVAVHASRDAGGVEHVAYLFDRTSGTSSFFPVRAPFNAGDEAIWISPNAKVLLARSATGVDVWNVAQRKRVYTIRPQDTGYAYSFPEGPVLFAPTGDRVAILATFAGFIEIWDLASAQRVTSIAPGAGREPKFAAYSPDGSTLAVLWRKSAGMAITLELDLWDPATGAKIATVWTKGGDGYDEVVDLHYTPDGTHALASIHQYFRSNVTETTMRFCRPVVFGPSGGTRP